MINTIKARIKEIFNTYSPEEAGEYLLKMDSNGKFNDIDYSDTSRGQWLVCEHLRRTNIMSAAYLYDKKLKTPIKRAVDYWFTYDFKNSNWWYNDLGVPQQLRMIYLNCEDFLPDDIKNKIIDRLQTEIEPKWTGTNKFWFAENIIFRGVLTNDGKLIEKGVKYIEETIFVSKNNEEGVQPDYSFAQHGMQLYNHGYGRTFITGPAKWFKVFDKTPYSFSDEKVKIIADLFLNGTVKMGRFDAMDFSAQSREIIRCYRDKNYRDRMVDMTDYVASAEILKNVIDDKEYEEKLTKSIEFILHRRNNPYEEYNSAFWKLDFMTHQRNNFYASVRMASKDVLGGDLCGGKIVNGENYLDGFGAYGLCVYMTEGKEYNKIFPVLDWGYLAGTSTPHIEMPLEIGGIHESEFVGFVSDKVYGVAAADIKKTYSYNGEEASFGGKKAYFFFDECVLHMGSGLYSTSKECFNTTIDQCNLLSDVYTDDKLLNKTVDFIDTDSSLIYHNNKAYLNLDNQAMKIKTGEALGNYNRIFISNSAPRYLVKQDTFTLVIPHGTNVKGVSYTYAVAPGIAKEDAENLKNNLPFKIIENSEKTQCAEYKNKIFAVFYESSSLKTEDLNIYVEKPCLMIYDKSKKMVFLQTPYKEITEINISINGVSKSVNMVYDPEHVGQTVFERIN